MRELRGLCDQSRLNIVFHTGKRVIDRLYGGDLRAWQQRRKGDRRYAKLKEHPELPLSRDQLHQSLQIYELCQRFPRLLMSKVATLSHALALLSLQPKDQETVVQSLEQKGWRVRELRQALARVSEVRPVMGRPRTPPVYKTLTVHLASEHAFEGKEELSAFDQPTVGKLLTLTQRALGELTDVGHNLEQAASEPRRARVLVVGANRFFLDRARRQLRRLGYGARCARSCKEAESRIDAETRCVVIDPVLPDGCGFQLAKRLTASTPGVQSIVITDQPKGALPKDIAHIRIVPKASALWPLRVALADLLRQGTPDKATNK